MSLDLKAKGFSLRNARELALYARMAYDEPPTIRCESTDTNILICELPECVIVACKGTASLRNFVTDAEAWRSFTQYGEVHSGAWYAWQSVEDQVFKALQRFDIYGTSKPVFWIGHSLGGLLAMIGALRTQRRMVIAGVYTFGCPRLGDKKFRFSYELFLGSLTFTTIYDCDIVPRVPGWLAGYRRPGHDEFISALNPQDIIQDPVFTYRLWSDIVALWRGWRAGRNPAFLDELIRDHHIDNYIKALDGILPEDCPTDSPAADQEAAK